jgi:hypothetical protein
MDNFTWALEAVHGHTTVVKDARELADAVTGMLLDRDSSRVEGSGHGKHSRHRAG